MRRAWRVLAATMVVLGLIAAPARAELIEDLHALPGVTSVEEATAPAGFRFFRMTFRQPVDHLRPGGATFEQRVTLLHRDVSRPMVLYTSGYNVSTGPNRSEPTRLLDGNQLSVEQRFFTPSRPEPADWSKLNIWQAAVDHHRLVQSFKRLYAGKWISTGASKGGMTSVYHRRFFPADVDGTVAYVAPNDSVNVEDSRYTRFFRTVGTPACRAALLALQKEALGPRRAELLARVQATAAESGLTFEETIGTADRSLELTVLDTPWAFWQYLTQDDCATVPPASATTDAIYDWIDGVAGWTFYTDEGLAPYIPYYFQAGTQLGWPQPSFSELRGLTRYPGLYEPRAVVPRTLPMRFDPLRMLDVDLWVRLQGSRLMFVYGGNDPWGSEPFRTSPWTRDSYWYEVPGGNHGSNIAALTPAEQLTATAALQRWAALPPAPQLRSSGTGYIPELDDYNPGLDRSLPF